VQVISVYRRPLMSTSLKFKTTVLQDFPGTLPPTNPLSATGENLPVDPFTGLFESLSRAKNSFDVGPSPTLIAGTHGSAQRVHGT
jgi:hypothetical protein